MVSIPEASFIELSDSESSGTSFLSLTVKNFTRRSSLSQFMRKTMPVLRSYLTNLVDYSVMVSKSICSRDCAWFLEDAFFEFSCM